MLHISLLFFFNDTATTEIYPLSLHDALPILGGRRRGAGILDAHGHGQRRGLELLELLKLLFQLLVPGLIGLAQGGLDVLGADRKSTRLNSSHLVISYAVFCLKKKSS